MTGALVLAILVGAGALGGVGYAGCRLVDRWLTLREGQDRRAALEWESLRVLAEAARATQGAELAQSKRLAEPLPEDLRALINQESERWCREEMEADYRARYAKMANWNQVRASIGIGTLTS